MRTRRRREGSISEDAAASIRRPRDCGVNTTSTSDRIANWIKWSVNRLRSICLAGWEGGRISSRVITDSVGGPLLTKASARRRPPLSLPRGIGLRTTIAANEAGNFLLVLERSLPSRPGTRRDSMTRTQASYFPRICPSIWLMNTAAATATDLR